MEKENVLEYLESRLRDNPKSLLFARLADLYLEQGKTEDAMVLCTEGVKHHPYYSTGYYVLAKVHVLKKEYDKAEGALKKVLSHDQQYLAAHKLLADILVKTGWESTAVEHYSAVLEIDPLEEKIRHLSKRYAAKPAPKAPLLGPTEDPSTALEDLAVLESKPSAAAPVQPEAARPPVESAEPTALTAPPEQVVPDQEPPTEEFQSLPDWTDQITEFHPDEEDSPPLKSAPAAETGFGAAMKSLENTALPDLGDNFAGQPVVESESRESADQNFLHVSPDSEDAGTISEEGLLEKPSSAGEQAAQEKLVDFTQDWFDLSSFENIEEKRPKKKEQAEPPLDIVEAGPGPAQSSTPATEFLFQKKEPREILTPSDLTPAAEESKAVPPPPPKPAESPAPPAVRKRPDFLMPDKSRTKAAEPLPSPPPAEPAPGKEKQQPAPARPDEKSELKIVTSTLGEIYAVQGQFDKAIQVYEAMLEKNPNEQKYIDKISDLKKKLKEASGK